MGNSSFPAGQLTTPSHWTALETHMPMDGRRGASRGAGKSMVDVGLPLSEAAAAATTAGGLVTLPQ